MISPPPFFFFAEAQKYSQKGVGTVTAAALQQTSGHSPSLLDPLRAVTAMRGNAHSNVCGKERIYTFQNHYF